MTFIKIAMTMTLILSTLASEERPERLSLPLDEGDSRTYQIVHAVESRSVEGASLTLEHNKVTITQGECSFGGQFQYDSSNMGFAWVEGSFFRNFGICKGPIEDVLMMVSDMIDLSKGYALRQKAFNSEWFVLGWNAEGDKEVDLLVGQKVLPNAHALNPEH